MGRIGEENATIAVMGATGSGKTTFINLASNSSLPTSDGLRSCTEVVTATTPFDIDGRRVVLVDTPGFDDTVRSDSDILKLIADFLASSYKDGHKLAGLLFLHRISDFRMGGISLKNFRAFRKLCGEQTLRNVVLVTNMWGSVNPQVGAQREQELLTQDDLGFKSALEKGAKMMRHDGSGQSVSDILRYILGNNNPMALQIQREIVDERKDVSQTAAAAEIERELRAERERQKAEAERIRLEMEAAARARAEQARRQLEAEAWRIQQEVARIEAERRRAQEQMERERLERERLILAQEEARRIEAARIQREHELALAEQRRVAEEARRRQMEEEERLRIALSQVPRRKKKRGLRRLFG
ncbi:hypothetical protein H1R20_g6235, partial [Candolleomyces eurysporus]